MPKVGTLILGWACFQASSFGVGCQSMAANVPVRNKAARVGVDVGPLPHLAVAQRVSSNSRQRFWLSSRHATDFTLTQSVAVPERYGASRDDAFEATLLALLEQALIVLHLLQ
jgi:hypothetical protein